MHLLKNNAHAMLKEVRALAESDRFDYLLIESTGIGGSGGRWGAARR
jgi:G3E family GTPase